MKQGFIQLHRQLLDSPCSTDPIYLSVWVYLLLQANHKPNDIVLQGDIFTVERGSFIGSLKKIADHFNVSLSKIKRVVDLLEKQKQVKTKRTTKYTYFTITNYDKYQASETQTKRKEKADRKQIETNNNDKTDNNDNKIPEWLDEKLWNDFVQHRKEIKKPMSQMAESKILTKLTQMKEKNYDIRDAINTAIENGWAGVFEPKPANRGNYGQGDKPSKSERAKQAIAKGLAEFG